MLIILIPVSHSNSQWGITGIGDQVEVLVCASSELRKQEEPASPHPRNLARGNLTLMPRKTLRLPLQIRLFRAHQ